MKCSHAVVVLLLCGLFGLAIPAKASVSGRRNTAIAASGLALYELATGHTTPGLLAGAGAYYAWSRYNKAHKHSRRRDAYMEGYREGVRRGYRTWYAGRRHRRRR